MALMWAFPVAMLVVLACVMAPRAWCRAKGRHAWRRVNDGWLCRICGERNDWA